MIFETNETGFVCKIHFSNNTTLHVADLITNTNVQNCLIAQLLKNLYILKKTPNAKNLPPEQLQILLKDLARFSLYPNPNNFDLLSFLSQLQKNFIFLLQAYYQYIRNYNLTFNADYLFISEILEYTIQHLISLYQPHFHSIFIKNITPFFTLVQSNIANFFQKQNNPRQLKINIQQAANLLPTKVFFIPQDTITSITKTQLQNTLQHLTLNTLKKLNPLYYFKELFLNILQINHPTLTSILANHDIPVFLTDVLSFHKPIFSTHKS